LSVAITTDYLLAKLSESITEGQLYGDLASQIEDGEEAYKQVRLIENQWTVKLQDDGYVVGTGLLLYDNWDKDKVYEEGDYVWHPEEETVFKCIEPHEDREPPNDSYWDEIEEGARSEFIVMADKFAVAMPHEEGEEPIVPFIVGELAGQPAVGIDGTLIVNGTILSDALATDIITVGHIGDHQEILNRNQLWRQILSSRDKPADGADVSERSRVVRALQEQKLEAKVDGKAVMVNGYLNNDFIRTGGIAAEKLFIGDINALDLLNAPKTAGADHTQSILDLGASIDHARVRGQTIIDGGYINTDLLQVSYGIVVGHKPPEDADNTSKHTASDVETDEESDKLFEYTVTTQSEFNRGTLMNLKATDEDTLVLAFGGTLTTSDGLDLEDTQGSILDAL